MLARWRLILAVSTGAQSPCFVLAFAPFAVEDGECVPGVVACQGVFGGSYEFGRMQTRPLKLLKEILVVEKAGFH